MIVVALIIIVTNLNHRHFARQWYIRMSATFFLFSLSLSLWLFIASSSIYLLVVVHSVFFLFHLRSIVMWSIKSSSHTLHDDEKKNIAKESLFSNHRRAQKRNDKEQFNVYDDQHTSALQYDRQRNDQLDKGRVP